MPIFLREVLAPISRMKLFWSILLRKLFVPIDYVVEAVRADPHGEAEAARAELPDEVHAHGVLDGQLGANLDGVPVGARANGADLRYDAHREGDMQLTTRPLQEGQPN